MSHPHQLLNQMIGEKVLKENHRRRLKQEPLVDRQELVGYPKTLQPQLYTKHYLHPFYERREEIRFADKDPHSSWREIEGAPCPEFFEFPTYPYRLISE